MINADLSRRSVLQLGTSAVLALGLPCWVQRPAWANRIWHLKAAPGDGYLFGAPYPRTPIWCYNGQAPGPEIRVRQGERLQVAVENALEQNTTVHWHGIRLPHHMDGVPGLSQSPIKPGETFLYDFQLPDAGTYWYHPHFNSSEQIGRGLSGPLIVEERKPIQIDRELTWVLDDWRLTADTTISEDFDHRGAMSHGGRLGNTVTVNGRTEPKVMVRSGERLRLRLINVANARVFAVELEDHEPQIIAIDGHPVEPHSPTDGVIVLGAAMRMDLVIDAMATPGGRFKVRDRAYRDESLTLLDLVYLDQAPLREQPLDASLELPANPIPEPNLTHAERHEVVFTGGAMGGMSGAMVDGQWTDIRTMARQGMFWAINGVATTDPHKEPLIILKRNQSCLLSLRNDTAFPHPIHLHGHAFRVLTRNGKPTRYREWQDTVLMSRGEQVDIAFVADNPGDWMFHCHILEHQASGMSTVIRVMG